MCSVNFILIPMICERLKDLYHLIDDLTLLLTGYPQVCHFFEQ